MTDLIGTRLSQYELTEIIRRGGMATVYKAYQDSLDRFVAIKVLLSNRDPQFAARFKREARAIAALQHHNILPVYDYGEQPEQGLLFLVMQYIENGTTLGDMLGKPMAPPTALRLTSHVLDALDYAHKRGVVHRDIKPANVLMPSPNWPMLADFGIVKLQNDNQARLTLANQIIGTAAYMAPEQATGRPIDARTDLYAAGVVLYELVTGRVPFDSDTPMAVLTKHVYEAPPPPRSLNPDLPASVEAALQVALAKDPNQRFQTAAEMAAELSQIASQLEQGKNRSQITGLYEVGVQAFEEGHWDTAVERLGKLVALDPGYEDATELLEAAREALERTRTEARQQIELLRQRRQSGIQQQVRPATDATTVSPATDATTVSPVSPATDATTVSPATPIPVPSAPATTKLPQIDEQDRAAAPAASVAQTPATSKIDSATPVSVPSTRPLVEPDATGSRSPTFAPASGVAAPARQPAGARRRLPIAWIIASGVAILLIVALLFILRGGRQDPVANATPTIGSAPTAGGAAATAAPIGIGEEPTVGAATEQPPVEAPAAPPPTGKLVFEDNFDAKGGKSGLEDNLKATDYSRGFHPPGVYHIIPKNPANATRWVLLPRLAENNFSLQITVWDESDDLAGNFFEGVIFRARDMNHFYALLLDPRNGRYTVRKFDTQQWSDLIPWKDSPLVSRQKEHNQVRVDAKDDTFTIYLNGKLADTFSDKSYGFGMLGMIADNQDAVNPHPHFDNVSVWSDDQPPKQPDLPAERKDPAGDMVLIPGGEFIMGGNDRSDAPLHIVSMTSFYIDRTEVTNAAYRQCVAASQCGRPQQADSATHPGYFDDPAFNDYPVVQVTWEQARQFCGWAQKRLPSEAEWEKAASWNAQDRIKLLYPFGNEFDPARLNSAPADGNVKDVVKVGSFEPELNGTVDMAGNASEWTNSLKQPYPYDEADGREEYPAPGERVFRGGSFAQTEGKARTYDRRGAPSDYPDREIGFRCAATPAVTQ
jgi:serine/threonine protein kinase/formylglycine-generating enzyme required for sulfatase activity